MASRMTIFIVLLVYLIIVNGIILAIGSSDSLENKIYPNETSVCDKTGKPIYATILCWTSSLYSTEDNEDDLGDYSKNSKTSTRSFISNLEGSAEIYTEIPFIIKLLLIYLPEMIVTLLFVSFFIPTLNAGA